MLLCSEHFNEWDYIRDLKSELLNLPRKLKLKCTAEPHLLLPANIACDRKGQGNKRDVRCVERTRKKLVNGLLELNRPIDNSKDETDVNSASQPRASDSEFEILKSENDSLKTHLTQAKEKISTLEKKLCCLEQELLRYKSVYQKFNELFSKSQREALLKGTCNTWENDDIAKAVTLRALSKKSYDYLRQVLCYPFPSPRTLQRRLCSISCSPGLIKLSLDIMAHQAQNLTDMEKNVILSFDEMKIDNIICYDSISDYIYGPCNNVQVILARSMTGNWKQPIFYNFDCPITPSLLTEIIQAIEAVGFKVRGFVGDMGPQNQKLLKTLNVNIGSSYIANPVESQRKVWAFCDVPHALKLLRNHLLDEGYILESGKVVNKEVLEKLVTDNSKFDLKYCHKLTIDHLLVTGTDRQNVRKAAELLSGTVSKAILHKYPEERHVAEFIRIVNDGFDVLNSRIPVNKTAPLKSAYGMCIEEQSNALNELAHLCKSMRVVGKTKMLPFQNAFLISIESVKGLSNDLKKEGFSYMMTSRVNQDVLESFFSQLRGLSKFYDHPSPVSVISRMKSILIGRNASNIFKTGNVTTDADCAILSSLIIKDAIEEDGPAEKKTCASSNTTTADNKDEDDNDKTEETTFLDSFDEFVENLDSIPTNITEGNSNEQVTREPSELITMLAGYLSYRLKKKFPTAYEEKKEFYGVETKVCTGVKNDWLQCISRGNLIRPSSLWVHTVCKLETSFIDFHGEALNKCENVMTTLTNMQKEKFRNIHPFVLKCFVRTRTFIRIKALNKRRQADKRKRYLDSKNQKKHKKMKKLTS